MTNIHLSGTNKETNRVPILLLDNEHEYIIGLVKAPHQVPTVRTYFKFFVNIEDQSKGARAILDRTRAQRETVELSVDGYHFFARITDIHEGLAGGAFDGINVPQQPMLMISTEPAISVCTSGSCADCGDKLLSQEAIHTPSGGTLCMSCIERHPRPLDERIPH